MCYLFHNHSWFLVNRFMCAFECILISVYMVIYCVLGYVEFHGKWGHLDCILIAFTCILVYMVLLFSFLYLISFTNGVVILIACCYFGFWVLLSFMVNGVVILVSRFC